MHFFSKTPLSHFRVPSDIERSYLIAPAWVIALASESGLAFDASSDRLPDPLPSTGLLVHTSEEHAPELPSGWAGVWLCEEAPPAGAWIPVAATHEPRAVLHALQAADAWRRERLAFVHHTSERAAALKTVNEIGIALSAERNPARLLMLILTRARHLVAADAGSIYLAELDSQGELCLRFALAQNDSVHAPWKEFVLPLNPHSLAGAVALSREVIAIADAYALPADHRLHHDRSFDRRFGYRTCSVVGIPLMTRDGRLLGVLQLINRKPVAAVPLANPLQAEEVVPFSEADVELLRSLASQAAVSLENSNLYKDIQGLFEGFVKASVMAIEQRDPTTSGHSFRVADGTLGLARCVERLEHGPWAGMRFSPDELRELRYAALLHDFGKVAVRENVLTKARKLHEEELTSLRYRFLLARAVHRASRLETWLHATLRDPDTMRQQLPFLEQELEHELTRFAAMFDGVMDANQPNVVEGGDFTILQALRQQGFQDFDGTSYTLLTDRELEMLSLRRGNLTNQERREIEKHVQHSFDFLRLIPWTRDLARIPEIAGRHHEKLDGSGYPQGLAGNHIPLGTRIMTIADIFDALVAHDRPYKKAMSLEQALRVLEEEAHAGKLDATLVQLWIDAKVWEEIGRSFEPG